MKKGMTTLLISVFLTSCGGDEITKEDLMAFSPKLSTASILSDGKEINGELGDYLTIKNKEVTVNFLELTNAEWVKNTHKQVWEIKLNVERTSKELEWDIETLNGNYTGLEMTIFDSKGQPIPGLRPISCNGHRLIDDGLSLDAGEDGWVTFEIELGDYPEEDIIKNWSKFKVGSKVGFRKESNDTEIDADLDSEGHGESLSEDEYDEMLNDYEDFVEEYIVLFKKSMSGDINAISSYPKLLEKAKKLDSEMDKARNNDKLTSKQISRFIKIQTKMLNAALKAM